MHDSLIETKDGSDDEMMSLRNTESIHGFYTGAPRTMKRIAPRSSPRSGSRTCCRS